MSHSHRGSAFVALIAGATLVALSACTTGEGGGGENETAPEVIRSAWITDPTTFDPALSRDTDAYRAARLGFDTLLRRDIEGEVIGGIAEAWEQSADRMELTIGDGHTCADGTPITASVVADSLAYLVDEETGSPHAMGIFGSGEATITGDDEAGTVSIELGEPYAELHAGLATPQAGIICPAGLEDINGLNEGVVEGAFSGPYVLAEANTGVGYQYELREDYSGWPDYSEPLQGRPASEIEFVVGAEDAVANQLLTGELDVAAIGSHELSRFESDGPYQSIPASVGEFYVMFNHGETSPFSDEEMRRAVAQVLDREALRDAIDPEGELIATIGDETMECANTDESLLVAPDFEAAEELLEGVTVRVAGTTAIGQNGAGAVYIQEQLLAAGAEVELTNVDVGSWISQIQDEPETWDITIYAPINNLGTISWGLTQVLGEWNVDGGRNVTRSENDEANESLQAALSADSAEEKCQHYDIVQRSALGEVNFIPISTNPNTWVVREGFGFSAPGGREDLTTLRILD